jgi:hypothetical protein
MDLNKVAFDIHNILEKYVKDNMLVLYDKGSAVKMTEFIDSQFNKDKDEWSFQREKRPD